MEGISCRMASFVSCPLDHTRGGDSVSSRCLQNARSAVKKRFRCDSSKGDERSGRNEGVRSDVEEKEDRFHTTGNGGGVERRESEGEGTIRERRGDPREATSLRVGSIIIDLLEGKERRGDGKRRSAETTKRCS